MVLTSLPAKLSRDVNSQPLIVGLALIPLLLVTLAIIPAIMIMPFMPNGLPRVEKYVAMAASWTVAILVNSHPQEHVVRRARSAGE